ncbi:MAG: hypothetical protein KatS3mg059_0850 [Thermomicrobiales bacterium]|nr:MAG: hypothetical protein KatS3mg059_0850 [Thermomicrobiales bacterium]
MCAWWGDVGSNAKTSDSSVIGDVVGFDILPGSDDVYNASTGHVGHPTGRSQLRAQHGLHRLGHLRHEHGRTPIAVKQKAAWSIAAATWAAKTSRSGCRRLPVGLPALPPEPLQHRGVGVRGATTRRSSPATSNSQANSYNHPNAAIEPRIPGIFQYYVEAELQLAKAFAGEVSAQEALDATAAKWEEITDQLGREQQIKLYQAALG